MNTSSSRSRISLIGVGLLAVGAFTMWSCSGGGGKSPAARQSTPPTTAANQSLFNKYGGLTFVQKLDDDLVAVLLADCSQNPYFTTVLGTDGHDTEDRLKGCLDLQLSSVMGASVTYPGPSLYRSAPTGGWPCENMATIHADLGIPSEAFDQFVSDFSAVLAQDGVSDADAGQIVPVLLGLEPQVVAQQGSEVYYNYTPDYPAGNGCTQVPPAPSPSPSPSASASPFPSPSPSMSFR